MAIGTVGNEIEDAPSSRDGNVALRLGVTLAGWIASVGGVLLFGLPPLLAVGALLLVHSPALFAPVD